MSQPENPETFAVVLDDEPAARDAAAGVLRECGMRSVIATGNGLHALELIASGRVALVVCDLAMPGMDGVQFIERLAAVRATTPLVLMSGTNDKVLRIVKDIAQELGLNLLGAFTKPILARDVRRILDRPEVAPHRHLPPSLQVEPRELESGIAAYEFEVLYQPIVRIRDGGVLGAEALLRWHHPVHGLLGPQHFIPLAERTGLIVPLTRYVTRHAIAQLGQWSRKSADKMPPGVSINISASSFGPGTFAEQLETLIAANGLSPQAVTLELTETALASSPEVLRLISRTRLRGFGLAIDDFGTGHSGLEQLRRLPFTTIKVDKVFVAGVTDDRDSRAIVEAGLALGRQLGLMTVAEGVESVEQWATLDSLGCDAAQGFWISPPIPAEQMPDWIARWEQKGRS